MKYITFFLYLSILNVICQIFQTLSLKIMKVFITSYNGFKTFFFFYNPRYFIILTIDLIFYFLPLDSFHDKNV